MANRFSNPDEQFFGPDGTTPLAGGLLFFYITGTSTKQNTYSDAGLTIANPNPVVLDSAGRAGPIFLQNLKYKVLLCPADDTDPPTSPIWTQDPVYTSDVSTVAQFASGNGNPNGNVAGTAGSPTIPASVYWDATNDILYVCTTTGSTSTAVWTAVNPNTTASVVPPPQGYLTPVSGTPIITGDSVAATTIYYTPYVGILVPIYNGTSFVPTSIVSELQYTLTSSLAASNIYDLYIFSLGGVATLGSGPSWSAGSGGSITAGACARGTGVGGSALTRLQGILTNAVSMTIRYGNGTTTTTVPANQATYVGSLYMDGTNGQVSCYRSYGQSRKWGIWNAYNRVPLTMSCGDSTLTWTYSSATVRPANNNTANSITTFTGLAEEQINATHTIAASTSAGSSWRFGIGFNSTTAFSGNWVQFFEATNFTGSAGNSSPMARLPISPALGINVLTQLEQSPQSASVIFAGSESAMLMTASYRG